MNSKSYTKKYKIINHSDGDIYKLLKSHNFKSKKISESYISFIKNNSVKAWRYHEKNNLNLFVIRGKVLFVTYINNKYYKYIIDEKSFIRLTIPHKIWYGFKGLDKYSSQILCFVDNLYDEKEILRKNINELDFDWSKYL